MNNTKIKKIIDIIYMETLQSKDISNEIVEISKETSLDELSIEPQIVSEVKPIEVKPILEEATKEEIKPIQNEPTKEEVISTTNKVSVCRVFLHLDKILLIIIISCAVLIKLIMDFPEFLLFSLISIIFTCAVAYGYLYPQKSMKVLERFMIMNMLVNPMAIGF
jgi:hypothetical protein